MKKLLTTLLVCAAMGACTQDAPEGEGLNAFGNLDETGLQFIEMLQKRPDWQTEWAEMTEHGQPLPSEMIVMSSMGSDLTFCFVPVVDAKNQKQVVRMIVAPIVRDTTTNISRLGAPKIFDEEGVDKDSVARSFIGLDFVKRWYDRGLEFDVKLTLSPEPASTRSLRYENGFNVFYTFYGNSSFVTDITSWANMEGGYIIQNYDPFPEEMTLWNPYFNGANWHVTTYYNTTNMPPVSIYIWAQELFSSYLYGIENELKRLVFLSIYNGTIYDIRATQEYMWNVPGMGGGVGNSDDCGGNCGCEEQFCNCATCDNCLIPIESISVNVSASSVTCLGESYTLSVTKSPSNATEEISSVDYFIKGTGLDLQLSNVIGGGSLTYMAKTPGSFQFKAEATIAGKESAAPISSAYSTSVTHRFPNATEVFDHFESDMESLWAMSVNAGTPTHTYEFAAVMEIDTRDGYTLWNFGVCPPSPPYTYNQPTFAAPFPSPPGTESSYNVDPRDGGHWVIGICHTHPSWRYAKQPRPAGRSTLDIAPGDNIPAWVMDYNKDYSDMDIDGNMRDWINPKKNAAPDDCNLEQYGGSGRTY